MRPFGVLLAASWAIIASEASSRLDVIDLPTGFFPEGITNGEGWTAFVGSLLNGNIWKGDLETGQGEVFELGAPGPAVGLDHDRRSDYLFVAGGPVGTARVYDEDFALVADLALSDGNSSFVNDVIITKTAAFFTDSFQPKIYKVNLDRETGALVDGLAVHTLVLSDNVPVLEGAFNVNGIEATDDGSALVIVNMESQQLFAVDPDTGAATLIDLGGELLPGRGDGLVLRKNTLWVVDNALEQILEVSLAADLSCGSLAPRALSNPLFDTQTTAMRKGNSLYAVNAKFGVAAEDVATTAYEIVRVDRDSGELVC
ncbi:superoxide dismutase [Ectocarpus siliculosus]|uniref:Superoxide dismutase n=1 Tax=Ectocarpus siliculosus TaxID=2880 RepID=D8LPY1_ECTSI|nr:superoxide dismutase [Ectocarpus siliculosus]|eukprot:CBN74873.1 superoxide dismutase [Ectocarpus siliculosus]